MNSLHPRSILDAVIRSLLLAACVIAGCSRGPRPIPMPKVSPSAAGRGALEQYDTDGDGVVKGNELDAAPALQAGLKIIDTDGDGGVSADEVAARVEAWRKSKVPLTPLECTIRLSGQPLEGATVRLVPEEFLGDAFRPAEGVTDEFGVAYLSIPKEDRPVEGAPSGVQFGLYRIEIRKQDGGSESVPEQYNSETTLGLEVSYDNPVVINPPLVFDLR